MDGYEISGKLAVIGVHRNGKRRFDPVAKERLVKACLEPGASVANLALGHGVNANLLWKWIRQHRRAQEQSLASAQPATPAFIPVHIDAAAERVVSRHDNARALDLRPGLTCPEVKLPEPDGAKPLSSPAKVNASLPNGVKLTLECGDIRAVSAVIGALCDVQTGR